MQYSAILSALSGSLSIEKRSTHWQSYMPWFLGSLTSQYSPALGAAQLGVPSLQLISTFFLPSLMVTITTPLFFSVLFTVTLVLSWAHTCAAMSRKRQTSSFFIHTPVARKI